MYVLTERRKQPEDWGGGENKGTITVWKTIGDNTEVVSFSEIRDPIWSVICKTSNQRTTIKKDIYLGYNILT